MSQSQLNALPVCRSQLGPLLELLLILNKLLLLQYPAREDILDHVLIAELGPERLLLVLDDLIVHIVNRDYLLHLVIYRRHLHEDDPVKQVTWQLVVLEELRHFLAGQEAVCLLDALRRGLFEL